MGLLLTAASLYVPQPLRKRKLDMLFNATADAFHMTPPSTRGKSCAECLRLYALFTREQADSAILHGKQAEVQSRLFQNAYHMGEQFRRDFKVTTTDVMRMGSLIYKMLQIDFEGKPDGNILIHRCFFSAYYSSEVCRLISSLDEGLLTGLAGGGSLAFKQRITEGHECCRAYLQNDGELN